MSVFVSFLFHDYILLVFLLLLFFLAALLATALSLKRFDQNNSVKGKVSCIESFLFVAPRALSSALVFGALCNGYDCVP